jgi:hypothetical protein
MERSWPIWGVRLGCGGVGEKMGRRGHSFSPKGVMVRCCLYQLPTVNAFNHDIAGDCQ